MQKFLCHACALHAFNRNSTNDRQGISNSRYCYLAVALSIACALFFRPAPVIANTLANSLNDNFAINIFEDRDGLVDLLGSALACRLTEELMIDLERSPVYTSSGAECQVAEGLSSDQNALFSDANCQRPMVLNEIPQQQYLSLIHI